MTKLKVKAAPAKGTAASYTEADISAFKRDTDKIRAKPNLFIGATDAEGLYTIHREPADNGVDEARAGRNKSIEIWLDKETRRCTIVDAGVGIPVKTHKVMGISTLTHVLTNLQSSGKLKKGAYDDAIGTHGVGIKATNALSSEFQIWTYRADSGGWHTTSFAGGREKVGVKKCAAPKNPDGKTLKLGTMIQFVPDTSIFGKAKLSVPQMAAWCEMTSYMNSGLSISLVAGGKRKTWLAKNGIHDYMTKRMAELKATAQNKKLLEFKSGTVELGINFADVEGHEVQFFTNTVRNVEFGTHADAFWRALAASLKPYKGKLVYTDKDLQEGMVGVVNCKINAPQFDSQTKEKLVDIRIKEPLYGELKGVFDAYWLANKALAKTWVQRAAALRERTSEFLKDKRLVAGVNKARKTMSLKLADVDGNSRTPVVERELYIVEGDSAGGTAKRARVRSHQAIYPIKGKILNVSQAKKADIVKSAELAGIFAALGINVGAADPTAKLRYGKVIVLADPDVDGSHINVLLANMFWQYAPNLVKTGRLYAVKAPEFLARHRDKVYFADTVEEIYKAAGTRSVPCQHIKGWGEVSEIDLRDMAMDPTKRQLIQLLPPKDAESNRKFGLLMGKPTAYRRALMGIKID